MDPKKITKKQSYRDDSDVQLNHNANDNEKTYFLTKQSNLNDGTKIKWILKFHILVSQKKNSPEFT